VEDSSNESDKYTRNFFRHQLIPLVEQAFPAAASNLADNLDRFRDAEILYRQAVDKWKKKLLEPRGNEIHIPVE
jgi:tRNA(Ile)-lysidine synthase